LLKRRRNATIRGIVLTDCPKRRRNIHIFIHCPKRMRNIILYFAPRGGGTLLH
jgi:hypothetical protein